MPVSYSLPATPEDIQAFSGAHGYAVVRRPSSATAPKNIGNPEGKMFGFTRVVFLLKTGLTDVYQVKDEEEGKLVAKTLVETGGLGDLKPNGGKYRVR